MGNATDSEDHRVPGGIIAVTDDQLWSVGQDLHDILNLQTALMDNENAWLNRMLGQLPGLIYEVEKLLCLVVSYALHSGEDPEDVAAGLGKPQADIGLWTSNEAKVIVSAALGEDVDRQDVSQIETWQNAVAATESAERHRTHARGLMHLLLLAYTQKYEADTITWGTDRVREVIRSGWVVRTKNEAHTPRGTDEDDNATTAQDSPSQQSAPGPRQTPDSQPAKPKTATKPATRAAAKNATARTKTA